MRPSCEVGGGDTVDDTTYLTRDPRSAGKQESDASEHRELLEAYVMDQRVGMPMHLPPLRSVAAKDPGHPQRPVLVRQSTDLAMLSLDHHQHDQIPRRVCLHYLQFCCAVLKEALQGFEALGRDLQAACRFSA